jgi:hypothetical protein
MLDTKNAAKWPLTTQNGFDGKKLVVKGHFTLRGSPRWQYETDAAFVIVTSFGLARFVTAVIDRSFFMYKNVLFVLTAERRERSRR